MIHEIFKFAMIIGILLGFSFIIYTNLSANRKDKSIIYLNFFVLFFTLNNLQITLADYNYINLNFFERKLLIPFYGLIIPAFYTFVSYYLKVEKQIKSYVIISGVLFIVEIIVRVALATQYYNDNNVYFVAKYAQLEEIVNLVYTTFLFLKVVYFFMNQSKLYENIATFDNMKWLKKFLIYGFLIIVLWVFAISFNFKEVLSPNIPVYYPLRLSSTLLIFWIAYHGFFQYNLLTERIELRKAISKVETEPFYKKDGLEEAFSKIENHILENKKYLHPKFSILQLEKEINLNHRKIADIIKANTKQNFTDYINELRVKKTIQILKDPEFFTYTNVAIGLECGFNSKSTFHREFYKKTGTTPSEYKKANT